MTPERPPRISVIFCEDVRQEAGNKTSILGVYSDILGISVPKAVMVKFVALCIFDLPATYVGRTFHVSFSERDQELVSFDISGATPDGPHPRFKERVSMHVPIEMMGLPVADGMEFRVRIEGEDVKHESAPLYVVHVPQDATGQAKPA